MGEQLRLADRADVPSVARTRGGLEALGDLFTFEDEATAFIEYRSRNAAAPNAPTSSGAMRITADGISFAYPGAERPTLQGVSLMIAPDEHVAAVGANGAGKNTLVRLLTVPAGYRPRVSRWRRHRLH